MAPTSVSSKGVPVHDCSIIAVTDLEEESDTISIHTTLSNASFASWKSLPSSPKRITMFQFRANEAIPEESELTSPKRTPTHKGLSRKSTLMGAINPGNWADRDYMKCITFSKTKDHVRWTPLHYAAKKGFVSAAARLIKDGIPIEARTMEDQTALHLAAGEGHLAMVKMLLEHQANYWASDKQQRSPASLAIEKDHLDIALALFNANGEKSAFAEEKSQLLTAAIYAGDKPRLRQLLPYCDPNSTVGGPRPLRMAVEKADPEVVSVLLQDGANPALRSADGSLPLALAVTRRSSEVVRILLAHGANPYATSSHGKSPFKLALERGDTEIIRILMERNSHPANLPNEAYTQLSTLSIAVDCNNPNALQLLLESGSNPSALEADGSTPLMRAAFPDRLAILDLLLTHGADPAGPDGQGVKPVQRVIYRAAKRIKAIRSGSDDLQSAIDYEKGAIEVLSTLMQYGADLHIIDAKGKNLLHLAAEAGLKRLVLFCLSNRFDVNGVDLNGSTPLHWAAYGGDVSTAQVLKLRGADPNAIDTKELTPLLIAAKCNHNEVAILLSSDSDLNHRDVSDRSALYYATGNENLPLAEHLLLNGAIAIELDYSSASPPSSPTTSSSKGSHYFTSTRALEIRKLGATFEIRQSHRLPNPSNLKRLLGLGASPNSHIASSPIICLAATASSTDQLTMLIAANADLNAADRNGQTALHIAASRGRTEVVEMLVAVNADLNAHDALGRAPEDVAGHPETAYVLITARQAAAKLAETFIASRPNTQPVKQQGPDTRDLGGIGMHRVQGISLQRMPTPPPQQQQRGGTINGQQRLAEWVRQQERVKHAGVTDILRTTVPRPEGRVW